MEASEILAQAIDKSKIPPLHQKRVLTFVNHFIISTCSFLNSFASKCEMKFMEIERKLQKVEAALTILESKLNSIPDLKTNEHKQNLNEKPPETIAESTVISLENTQQVTDEVATTPVQQIEPPTNSTATTEPESGQDTIKDPRYDKFLKMLRFGVPAPAVKLKMLTEGLDPTIITE